MECSLGSRRFESRFESAKMCQHGLLKGTKSIHRSRWSENHQKNPTSVWNSLPSKIFDRADELFQYLPAIYKFISIPTIMQYGEQ